MIEIAIAVAVIAFALVAIIGVLPAGLQVQKENREDTIIAQEGVYWMEAIRSGAAGPEQGTLGDLVDPGTLKTNDVVVPGAKYTASHVIGSLSTLAPMNNPFTNSAVVRAISGSVADKTADTSELAFKYKLEVEITPYDPDLGAPRQNEPDPRPPESRSREATLLPIYLYQVRLNFRWPVVGSRVGNNHQTFRSLVSGTLTYNTNTSLYFFRP